MSRLLPVSWIGFSILTTYQSLFWHLERAAKVLGLHLKVQLAV